MPIIQTTNQKTQYFKLKNFEFTKPFYSKTITVKEPAFVIWDGEKEVEVGQTFKGNLYDINLGEAKEITTKQGAKLTLTDIFFEFRSLKKDKKLIKEVVVLTYPSQLFEKLIQKLAGVTDFKNLKINVGQYPVKDSQKKKDYITLFENNKKLPNIINFKSTKPEYPDPEGLIEIPPIEYIEVDGEAPIVHPNWKSKLKKLYWSEFEKIQKRLEEFRKNNYGEEFFRVEDGDEFEVDISEIDNSSEEESSQRLPTTTESISPFNEAIAGEKEHPDTFVNMPF